jgi:hypothetical protein
MLLGALTAEAMAWTSLRRYGAVKGRAAKVQAAQVAIAFKLFSHHLQQWHGMLAVCKAGVVFKQGARDNPAVNQLLFRTARAAHRHDHSRSQPFHARIASTRNGWCRHQDHAARVVSTPAIRPHFFNGDG